MSQSYGLDWANNESVLNTRRREFDSKSGLYYYRARYYDPSVGRFNGEDPFRWAGGVNLYEYVSNRVVIATDPEGLAGPSQNPDLNCLICTIYGRGRRSKRSLPVWNRVGDPEPAG